MKKFTTWAAIAVLALTVMACGDKPMTHEQQVHNLAKTTGLNYDPAVLGE
jgi:hypothetical protein